MDPREKIRLLKLVVCGGQVSKEDAEAIQDLRVEMITRSES